MNESTKQLAAALVAAQQAAQSVVKGSTNAYDRYNYASADAVIEEGRAALNTAGLSFSPERYMLEMWEGQIMLHVWYRLEHSSGESRVVDSLFPIVQIKRKDGVSPLDKAVAAARTYSLGYVLRDLLLLPRVEKDADVDQRDERRGVASPPVAGAQATKPVAKADPLVFRARIEAAKNGKDLHGIGTEIAGAIMADAAREMLTVAWRARAAVLRAAAAPPPSTPKVAPEGEEERGDAWEPPPSRPGEGPVVP